MFGNVCSVIPGQPSAATSTWTPTQLQLEYQLYQCPPTTLRCSLVPPPSQLHPQTHLPHIITNLNKPSQTCIVRIKSLAVPKLSQVCVNACKNSFLLVVAIL